MKGSSGEALWRRFCRAMKTVPPAVARINSSRIRMRALVRWSAISLKTTAHKPVQGEPSRRRGLVSAVLVSVTATSGADAMFHLLKVLVVDVIQAKLFHGQRA